MFEEAFLRIVSSKCPLVPFGNYCDVLKGLKGTSLLDYKNYTIESLVSLLNMISLSMMKGGGLELTDGRRITSEEERQALMKDITSFVKEGGSTVVSDWVAMRPAHVKVRTVL